jgi:hypothetical protein
MVNPLALCFGLLMVSSARGQLGVHIGSKQSQIIPRHVIEELASAGSFSYFMIDSTVNYPFLRNTGLGITLALPNDVIKSFATDPSFQLNEWVVEKIDKPTRNGYNITNVILGDNSLSVKFNQRFYTSLPLALQNVANKLAPFGIRV